ncbi:hypothetical protein P5P86_14495 [Nocardioides sp. BP30]|uniref:hypothetical protein n=1 Tax=Nocardioides sp. BP30 TaxID=3036374 RepID=UPI002469426D|nr:hypothetical protein [Nocardioides sp. BP30]WGL51168.1 hypothetical protein P5P86_14495 [Nocardioides sp. BP30]
MLDGIDLRVGAPCVPTRSDSGGSQTATARVGVPANAGFDVRVLGGVADHWLVAVSQDAPRP